MSTKAQLPTAAQLIAMRTVDEWAGRGGTYMPFSSSAKSYEAAERKGYLEYRTVNQGSPYNGYALTPAGRAALAKSMETE